MPKATFFRLPKAKQQRLMDAAYQEFARAPFNEASISNIIKQAGIPRGSYYQYFDLFLFAGKCPTADGGIITTSDDQTSWRFVCGDVRIF